MTADPTPAPTDLVFRVFNEIGIIAQLAGNAFERVMPDGMTLAQILPDAGPPPELPTIGLLSTESDCCVNIVR